MDESKIIEHEGREYAALGSYVTNERAVAYVGKGMRELTDWEGNVIGTCVITASWPIRSYVSNRMYQIRAHIGGRFYTGRSAGEGMIWQGKACK